jgi:rhodanese-related sulfurtransferase
MENRGPLFLVNLDSYLECLDARIPGAICLDGGERSGLPVELPADKETKLVFYGRQAGGPAPHPIIAEVLQRGYQQVYILTGGLLGWRRSGYDVESVQRIPRTSSLSLKPSDVGSWLRQTPSALIVDIRVPKPLARGMWKGHEPAPLLPHRRYPEIPLDRTLLVIDEEGSRAFMVASYLSRKGFTGVRRLAGGKEAWDATLKRGTAR